MTVHLFGAVSSPGCANFGLKKAADLGKDKHGDDAARFVQDDFYVDDGLTSLPTVSDAIHLVQNTKQLCADYGIKLHRFASNSPEVLEAIPPEERAKCLEHVALDSNVHNEAVERVLGIEWHIASDTFRFQIKIRDRPITRRGILSAVSQVYDPLGFLSPVILVGRQILQDACKKQLDWDAPLPDDLKLRWERWKHQLPDLERLAIKRCFKPDDFGNVSSIQLHHFSDASSQGYGQCSYVRLVNEKGDIHVALVCAKARVAPVKQVTIPRLELTAAVLSTKVSRFLRRELMYGSIEEF